MVDWRPIDNRFIRETTPSRAGGRAVGARRQVARGTPADTRSNKTTNNIIVIIIINNTQ